MGIKASLLVILVTLTFGFSLAKAEEDFRPSEFNCNPQDNPELNYEETRSCMLFYRFRARSLANINQPAQINTHIQAFTANGGTTPGTGVGIDAVQAIPPDGGIVSNGSVVEAIPPDGGIVQNPNTVNSVGSLPANTSNVNNTTNADAPTLLLNIWRAK